MKLIIDRKNIHGYFAVVHKDNGIYSGEFVSKSDAISYGLEITTLKDYSKPVTPKVEKKIEEPKAEEPKEEPKKKSKKK